MTNLLMIILGDRRSEDFKTGAPGLKTQADVAAIGVAHVWAMALKALFRSWARGKQASRRGLLG